jgi:hypothetical protein
MTNSRIPISPFAFLHESVSRLGCGTFDRNGANAAIHTCWEIGVIFIDAKAKSIGPLIQWAIP